ncbi:MAG TPA: serine/threonine-protein kinase, partial [Gemmatimonadales bacterium]|nr:serine/threonine-protein kinase [Gemmatimonadales bacterium]
ARDVKHDRLVALKVLRPELGVVLGSERFLAEIRITARLDHPHILTLIDSGAADGFLYYVLPYVPGESLRAKLDREHQLGLAESLAITRQVLSALDYAHRQGVVHRDIKPENVLLQEGEAMLADFGIALALKEAGGNRLTESGLSLGTPQYMSPEQATGDRHLDGRSDIYSLAAVLYEMLAGEPPITGPTAQAMIAKLLTERPTPLRILRDTVPAGVEAAVTQALAKTPADRFRSARAFAEALERPETVPSAAGSRAARARVTIAATALVTLAAAAWLAVRRPFGGGAAFTPRLEQLTTNGDTRNPTLSPDGTRLAFVTHDCGETAKRCPDRLVVQDTGGAGSVTLLSGGTFYRTQWAAGGRFVVAFRADTSGRSGSYAVSALGGISRYLGPGIAFAIGATDTALLSSFALFPADSTAWLRLLTVSDGVVRDSIPLRRSGGPHIGFPAPRGDRIAVCSMGQVLTIRLLDRAGRITDSLIEPRAGDFSGAYWTPQADALLWVLSPGAGFIGVPGAPGPVRVLRRRVTPAGRFSGTSDTLLQLPPGADFTEVRRDGTALLAQGSVQTTAYALERARTGRLEFHERRLVASTAGLQAFVSRDGANVWLFTRNGEAGSTPRDAFMPFAGGGERPFTAPRGTVIDWDWSRPISSSLMLAVRDSAEHTRLVDVSVATGRATEDGALPDRDNFVFSMPGGGSGAIVKEAHSALVRRPGKPDTTWTVPAMTGRVTYPMMATADGRAFISFAYDVASDSFWLTRVPLDGGPSARLAALRSATTPLFIFLADGGVEYMVDETATTRGWYRVPPGASRAVRLGDAPLQGAVTWSVSDDGLRVVAVKRDDRTDAYLIRNFDEALRR